MGSEAGLTEISIGREWPELVLAFLLTLAGWVAYRQRPAVVNQIARGFFGGALALASIATSLAYPFYFAHCIAALTAVFAFLIARGVMLLSGWRPQGTPAGILVAVFLCVGGLLAGLRVVPIRAILGLAEIRLPHLWTRLKQRLLEMDGRHLV